MSIPQPSAAVVSTAKEGVTSPGKVEEKKSAAVTEESPAEITDNSDESENEALEESGEESESDGEGTEEELEAKDGEARKPQNGVKKRIDKLRSRISEKDQRILALEAELAARSRGPAEEPKQVDQPKHVESQGAPNPEDFETVADYVRAQTKFELAEEKRQEKARVDLENARSEAEKLETTHRERVNKYAAEVQDYKEVVQAAIDDLGDMTFKVEFGRAIQESDLGPAVFYELAKTPSELERINSLPYGSMMREIGKIEARLEKQALEKESKPEIKKTNAPAPISPLKASGKAPTKSLADLDYDEYRRVRNEQERKRK